MTSSCASAPRATFKQHRRLYCQPKVTPSVRRTLTYAFGLTRLVKRPRSTSHAAVLRVRPFIKKQRAQEAYVYTCCKSATAAMVASNDSKDSDMYVYGVNGHISCENF